MQEVFKKIIEQLEDASWWTSSTFDEDGYGNDDSEEVLRTDTAIEIVNQVANDVKDKYVSIETLKQVMWERDIAIDQLNQLGYGLGEKVGWIPCSERLPKMNQDVLVFRPKMAMSIIVDRYQGYYGEDDEDWYEGWFYSMHTDVTAWQPLPKFYKEMKNE